MKTSDFEFELPEELIAQHPPAERAASRLLVLDGADGSVVHRQITELPSLLAPGDLLVVNDTRVIPARLHATKATGGAAEVLVERVEDDGRVLAHVRASRTPKPGVRLILHGGRALEPGETGVEVEVTGRSGELFELDFPGDDADVVLGTLDRLGHVPLPPYIRRDDDATDRERYQTVFAREPGAVAAPTAGLHFDAALLERLAAAGIERTAVTLHVGAGTFQPVRTEQVEAHRMHSERYHVGEDVADAVRRCRARGGRVVALGTTALRALESAASQRCDGVPAAGGGETDIFIYPGHRFRCVDALVTNFHLPGSTLLMLVSALAGRERVLAAYREAVAERYRFFSYGDAMLIWPDPAVLMPRETR